MACMFAVPQTSTRRTTTSCCGDQKRDMPYLVPPARASDAALTLPTKSFKAPLCGPQLCPPQHVDPLPPVVANRCVRDLRGASTTPRTD